MGGAAEVICPDQVAAVQSACVPGDFVLNLAEKLEVDSFVEKIADEIAEELENGKFLTAHHV